MSWSPQDLTDQPLQDALDAARAEAYDARLAEGLPVLRELSYDGSNPPGTFRRARGQRCYLFDGMASGVNLGPTYRFARTQPFSIALRIKKNTGSDRAIVQNYESLGSWDGWLVYLTTSQEIQFSFFSSISNRLSVTTTAVLPDGFVDVVVQYDGSSTVAGVKIFFDGSEQTLTDLVDSLTQDPVYVTDTIIGTRRTNDLTFDGWIAKVAFYDRMVSTLEADTIGQYNCNEEAGTTSYDSSGNGNHGTILNATLEDFHATDPGVTSNRANEVGFTSGDVVSFGDILDDVFTGINAVFSIELDLVVPNTIPANGVIAAKLSDTSMGEHQRQWQCRITTDRRLEMIWYGALTATSYRGSITDDPVAPGTHTVRCFYDGTVGVDTRLSFTINDTPVSSTQNLTFGNPSTIPEGTAPVAVNGAVNTAQTFGSYTYDYATALRIWQADTLRFSALRSGDWQDIEGGANPTIVKQTIIPIDESAPTQDVLSGDAQYTGKAPQLITCKSPVLTFDGTASYGFELATNPGD